MGRPTKYSPDFCAQVIEFGKEGFSKAEMAAALDIAYSTFDLWEHEIPEFSEAVKNARRKSQAWWEGQGRVATFGGCEGFSATSYIFQMKNRFREDWNDTQRVVGPGPEGEHKYKVEADDQFRYVAGLLGLTVPGGKGSDSEAGGMDEGSAEGSTDT